MNTLNIDPVSPSEALILAEALVTQKKIPFFLHGSPGIGKSDIVAQIADKHKMNLEILMLTQIDSQDLRGIQYPDPVSKRMVYYPPEFLPGPESPPTLLFLDELTGAEPRLQVSAYQLLLSRRIGSYTLPDNCYVCAAGNGPSDGAVAYTMGTALASRLLHISVTAEPRSWLAWAMENNIHSSVLTLIQLKGDLLEQTQQQLKDQHIVGPNPRQWARVSSVLHDFGADNRQLVEPLVAGLVGRSAAAELFLTVEEMKGLPSPSEILKMTPMQFNSVVPKTIATMYGLVYSLVAYSSTVDDMAKSIKFMEMMVNASPNLPGADCMSLGMELILERSLRYGNQDALMLTKEFQDSYSKVAAVNDIGKSGKKAKK